MKRFILLLLGCLTVCVILAGCSEKLTLDQTQLDMTVGDSAELSAGKATRVSWESNNDAVATVIGGEVNAKSAGEAIITASLENGETATCRVKVSDKLITEIPERHRRPYRGRQNDPAGSCLQARRRVACRAELGEQ